MNHLGVGDPAASSLSSCLCAFPGGFSLLTETGLLRPFLVSETSNREEGSAAEAIIVAATPLRLSLSEQPSPTDGTFPAGGDVPIDHAWSQDGHILVVLRRSSYTAYCRDSIEAVAEGTPSRLDAGGAVFSQHRPTTGEGNEGSTEPESSMRSPPSSTGAPSLGLAEAHTGSNGFEGKVVACCLPLGARAGGEAAAAPNGSRSSSGERTYLIAVGGAFGVECHALECRQCPQDVGAEKIKQSSLEDGGAGNQTASSLATCRRLTSIFQGYPVVALAFSQDSRLMAAASMTGHVKVWDVDALAAPPPPQQSNSNAPPKKEAAAARGRGGGKKKGVGNTLLSATRPSAGCGGHSDIAPLWGIALPMARATSLSFSPDDNATFALACWDGKVALFFPTSTTEATASPPDAKLPDPPWEGRGGGSKDVDSKPAWKQVWREATAATPGKTRGGKGGGNLEDQDGTFLCWSKEAPGSEAPAADLAVSAYRVTSGDCARRRRSLGNVRDNLAASSGGETAPTPTTTTGEPPRPKSVSLQAFPPAVVTGPGFEIFAERGLGERVGGAVSGARPAGLTPEPTAERYLIHGLAAGSSFVALYDSDLCLHVASNAAILSAGQVFTPPPPPPPPPTPYPIAAVEAFSAVEDPSKKSPGSADVEASTLLSTKVTLVSNDHGLIAAYVRQHRGPEGGGVVDIPPAEDGLELSVMWRNAISRVETPDDGKCTGRAAGEGNRRLSFLPGELESNDGPGVRDGGNGGVFGADVRWGRFALFTRYTVLVYTRPDEGETAGKPEVAKGGNDTAVSPLGGWRAYAEHPVVHGVLLGGSSTATPLSQRLPKPPADLTDIYLLTVLGADRAAGGGGPLLSIRSLGDRTFISRCPLTVSDADADAEAARVAASHQGAKVYVPPGYGGGSFVVAIEGGARECARVWRGTFDGGRNRLELGSSRVITSYPWPDPETLCLQGVAGPNCELFLFKEVGGSSIPGGAASPGSCEDVRTTVRWWMTWPEAETWRWVDAPALLGDEELTVSDLVNIFQLEIEEMLSSYSTHLGSDSETPSPPQGDSGHTGAAVGGGGGGGGRGGGE